MPSLYDNLFPLLVEIQMLLNMGEVFVNHLDTRKQIIDGHSSRNTRRSTS